jgi:uncharacterized membrane protein YoaK (UPF0700 family)
MEKFNWAAAVVLAAVVVLGVIGVLAVLHPIDPNSHDIVLAIVSGLVGALSMKAVDGAVKALSAPQQPGG